MLLPFVSAGCGCHGHGVLDVAEWVVAPSSSSHGRAEDSVTVAPDNSQFATVIDAPILSDGIDSVDNTNPKRMR